MFKKGIALVLAIVMIAALCISASAMELTVDTLDPMYNVVIIDESGNISYDYDPTIPETDAICDNSYVRGSIVVTASDVWRVVNLSDHGYEYWAEGYVTAAQRHYARAEMWYNNQIYAEGFTNYGYGKVDSTSQICWGPYATPKIFYGV